MKQNRSLSECASKALRAAIAELNAAETHGALPKKRVKQRLRAITV